MRSLYASGIGIGLAAASLAGFAFAQEQRPSKVFYDYVDERTGLLGGGIAFLDAPAKGSIRAVRGASYVTTLDNGDPANRIDIVMVGDGYRTPDLGSNGVHAAGWQTAFLSEPPFDAYQTYFNFHRVDVVSNETGVDHDPTYPIFRDTALGMGFWCANIERLLCVSVGQAYLYANNAPDVDQVVAIANSTKYGGAGYPGNDLATFAGGNGLAPEIALHELGHSLGDLADEYHYGDGATYTGGEPFEANLSIQAAPTMATTGDKWALWLDEFDPAWDGLHASFEGGGYHQFGIYRPTDNSKMRSLGRPFNLVSAEAMIIEIYRIVRPIDAATPNTSPLAGDEVVSLTLVQPVDHALDVQWYLDGSPLLGENGTSINLASLGLAAGNYSLLAEVVDNTPLVRNALQREAWLTQRRAWTIEVGGCPNAGDLNCDGLVTVSDIGGFVLAIGNPAAYAAAFPACSVTHADVNCDGLVTVSDIGPFVQLLAGG